MQTHQCSDSMQTRGCSTPCKLIDAPTPSPNIIRCRGCLFQWHDCSDDMFVPVTWLFRWHVVCSSDMVVPVTCCLFQWHVSSDDICVPVTCLFQCHVCSIVMFVPVPCLFWWYVCASDMLVPGTCLSRGHLCSSVMFVPAGFFFKLHHNHNLYCSQANVQCPPSSSNNCLSATVFFIALVAQFILTIGYFVYR